MKKFSFRTICVIAVLLPLFAGCSNKNEKNELTKSIIEADNYYSRLSLEKGRNTAFLAMFDSAGVMLASHHRPIEGIGTIRKLLLSRNDTTYILIWKPTFANVANSGELGYSYGIYALTSRVTKKVIEEGTYTTIWQKNAEGKWKAVLDTGNEGVK
jgi:ketosteroid isomerase-like protein